MTPEHLEALIDRLEFLLSRLEARMSGTSGSEKTFYSTAEVAKILGRSPFTIREYCRLGRCNAERAPSGRGTVPEWRISAAELQRIQNSGLLPSLPSPKHRR